MIKPALDIYLGRPNYEIRAYLKDYGFRRVGGYKRKRLIALYCSVIASHFPHLKSNLQ